MPRSRPRKGCAPCHPRWDQGLSDSGPSAATRRRRPAGAGPRRPRRPVCRSGPDLQHLPEPALCRSTGGALPDVEGLTSGGSRFGGEAVQRGLGRPERGDGGRPAQNGEEGRRQSERVPQSGVRPVQAPRLPPETSCEARDPAGSPPRTWGHCPARTRARVKASPGTGRGSRRSRSCPVSMSSRGHRCPRPRHRRPPHHPLIPNGTGKGAAPEPYGTVRGSPFTCSDARCALTRPSSGSGRRRLPPARSAGRRAVPTSPRHGR